MGHSGHGAMMGPFTAAAATALVEAGRDVDTVRIDGEPVSMRAFALSRDFSHAESMVI